MMRPGRLWWLLRRDWARGWQATWGDYVTAPKIRRWRNPHRERPAEAIPVHVLCGIEQFPLMLWMLASWFDATGRNWPVVVHDDGTLTEEAVAVLGRLLPEAKLVRRAEADARLEDRLDGFPACLAYRRLHPLALKVFDMPAFAAGNRYILLDSDVLFFRTPRRILEWIDNDEDGSWFNEDVQEAANVPVGEAFRTLGIRIWPKVNSGLCLLQRASIDLPLCEKVLKGTSILQGHIWRVEQTLLALCASAAGRGGLLPAEYEVSLNRWRRPDAVARHYVGAVRDRFYGEGIPCLCRRILQAA